MGTMAMLMGFGVVLTTLAAVSFRLITGRQATLAFEDGDARAAPLALLFRFIAAPGILVCSQFEKFASGGAGAQAIGGMAVGVIWGAVYGIGLGVVV